MHPILKNILVVLAGLVVGSVVNMAIVNLSSHVIAPPLGVDMTTVEGLTEGMGLLQPKHYLMPFLAHAFGTLVGAFIVARFAAAHRVSLALLVGVFFLIGGIIAVYMIPAPTWFAVVDLLFAYIPMAYIGACLGFLKAPIINT